jgi:SAM-dependent methyltransferase
MRADWNRRAKEDANFYVAFGRRDQSEAEFANSAEVITPAILRELVRLPPAPARDRRALDIGCGPGRLMLPLADHFGEIHGIDVSDEMIKLARARLNSVPHAHLHVGSGSDLQPFENDYFDLVYSYVVFQHIPSQEIVLNYLREAQRVLKPGGILCCQTRGRAPKSPQNPQEPDTWSGCTFDSSEILEFARASRFPLVALEGTGTQYMWTIFRKRLAASAPRDPMAADLKAVTSSSGPGVQIPARGPSAVASLWIDRLTDDGDLSNFPVLFGDRRSFGNYLSPISESGGCQMNVRLPEGIEPGRTPVRLCYRETTLSPAHNIEVIPPPPLTPKLIYITDAVNLTSHNRAETGALKVTLEEIEHPNQIKFSISARPAQDISIEVCDPITSRYAFFFKLPANTPGGRHPLEIKIGTSKLQTIEVQVL